VWDYVSLASQKKKKKKERYESERITLGSRGRNENINILGEFMSFSKQNELEYFYLSQLSLFYLFIKKIIKCYLTLLLFD
jgi:hypothetical protein